MTEPRPVRRTYQHTTPNGWTYYWIKNRAHCMTHVVGGCSREDAALWLDHILGEPSRG